MPTPETLFFLRVTGIAARFVCLFALLATDSASGANTRNAPSPQASKASARRQEPQPLTPGKRLQARIASNETQSYWFPATAGQYLCFAIGRSTSHIRFSVIDDSGQEVARQECRRCEFVPLSLLPVKSGSYCLQVRSQAIDGSGQYDLTWLEERPATVADRKRLLAERALNEGEALQAAWDAEASQQALEKYRAALLYWRAGGAAAGQARALLAFGAIQQRRGELQQAFESYTQAYALAKESARLRAAIALELSTYFIFLGNAAKAETYGMEALELSRRAADRVGEGRARLSMGVAAYYQNRLADAAAHTNSALSLARDDDDLAGEALALRMLGYINADITGRQEQAYLYLQQAQTLWQRLGDQRGYLTTLVALGHLDSLQGEKQKALDAYQEAEIRIRHCGEPASAATLYAGMGYVYEELGERAIALRYYLKALSAWRVARHTLAEVEALAQVGRLYRQLDDPRRALRYLLEAKQRLQNQSSPSFLVTVLTHLGEAYAALGNSRQALQAYRAVLATEQHATVWVRVQALTGIAKLYQRRGDYGEALVWHQRTLTVSREAREPAGQIAALCQLARAERASGNFDKALARLDEASRLAESGRAKFAGLDMRASYFSTTREVYELTIDILSRRYRQSGDGQDAVRAFETSERGRARSLLDMLSESRAKLSPTNNPALSKDERELRERITEHNRQLSALYADKAPAAQIQAVESALEKLIEPYERVQASLRAASPRYAALTAPEPLTLSQIQQLLDADTVLLEYSLGEDASHLWAVTPTDFASYALPPRREVEAAARQVYELLTAANQLRQNESDFQRQMRLARAEAQYPAAALRLSRLLFEPIAGQFAGKRLVIVADGALHYIPFSALPIVSPAAASAAPAASARPRFLLAEHEVISLPSASALAALRRELSARHPAPDTVAVIADPVFQKDDERLAALPFAPSARLSRPATGNRQPATRQPRQWGSEAGMQTFYRLPYSGQEAQAILALAPQASTLQLLGLDATPQAVASAELNRYRIVHFATHGILKSERPELSAIILSLVDKDGRSQNGFLRLQEIYNLRLAADLVVLSACQTALGKEIRGEGLVGLTRGFLYAGAARVVASLWNVNDVATAELMSRFYKRLLQGGERPAAALRGAQREMLQHHRWRLPYYWAAFTLQGEWR